MEYVIVVFKFIHYFILLYIYTSFDHTVNGVNLGKFFVDPKTGTGTEFLLI
jgi:hypothetical protein